MIKNNKIEDWEKELHIAMEEVQPADWYYDFIRKEKEKSYQEGRLAKDKEWVKFLKEK